MCAAWAQSFGVGVARYTECTVPHCRTCSLCCLFGCSGDGGSFGLGSCLGSAAGVCTNLARIVMVAHLWGLPALSGESADTESD